jgi:hypothetical protein
MQCYFSREPGVKYIIFPVFTELVFGNKTHLLSQHCLVKNAHDTVASDVSFIVRVAAVNASVFE